LELSHSIWLITSLSPCGGEKLSKHSVSAGDIAALLARFLEIKEKAFARTGKSFPIIVIHEADAVARTVQTPAPQAMLMGLSR
jgi:transposase